MARRKKGSQDNRERMEQKREERIRSQKKILIITCIAIVSVLLITIGIGFIVKSDSTYKPIKSTKDDTRVVATCGEYDILYDELRFVTLLQKNAMIKKYGEDIFTGADAEKYRKDLEASVWDKMNSYPVIRSMGKEIDLNIGDKKLEEKVTDEIKKLFDDCGGTKKDYKEYLTKNNLSDRFLRYAVGCSLIESSVHLAYVDNLGIIKYNTDKPEQFVEYALNTKSEYARSLHVFIKNSDDNVEENRQRSIEIMEDLKSETDLAARFELLKRYIGSDGMDISTTVDGYYFSKGEMNKKYEDAVFGLEVGEISDVLENDGGFYVIMRLAPEEAFLTKNAESLILNYQGAQLGLMEEERAKDMPVQKTEFGGQIELWSID